MYLEQPSCHVQPLENQSLHMYVCMYVCMHMCMVVDLNVVYVSRVYVCMYVCV